MPEESSINVCIYAGGGDNEIECANIPIDATLPFCIISKRWVDHLGVKYNPAQKTSVTDATGAAHSIIGNVDLLWHRTSLTKSNPEKFLVVDSKTQLIKMRKNAISKGKEKEVDTVRPKKQTEEEKRQQEKRAEDRKGERAKEKEAQTQKDKQKFSSGNSKEKAK